VCTDGHRRTGVATCVGSEWVCAEEACTVGTDAGDAVSDAGSDAVVSDAVVSDGTSGCDGTSFPVCDSGRLSTFCCPPGAPCRAPSPVCDLGGGACLDGPCPDAGCTAGSMETSGYDHSCASDADCAAVYAGSLCSKCFCPNDTVNTKAFMKYQEDFSAKGVGPSTCSCPVLPKPYCKAGTCAMPSGI
jgi:hypothetical protein